MSYLGPREPASAVLSLEDPPASVQASPGSGTFRLRLLGASGEETCGWSPWVFWTQDDSQREYLRRLRRGVMHMGRIALAREYLRREDSFVGDAREPVLRPSEPATLLVLDHEGALGATVELSPPVGDRVSVAFDIPSWLTVQVVDAAGAPVPNFGVGFGSSSGSGHVHADSHFLWDFTDESGRAILCSLWALDPKDRLVTFESRSLNDPVGVPLPIEAFTNHDTIRWQLPPSGSIELLDSPPRGAEDTESVFELIDVTRLDRATALFVGAALSGTGWSKRVPPGRSLLFERIPFDRQYLGLAYEPSEDGPQAERIAVFRGPRSQGERVRVRMH